MSTERKGVVLVVTSQVLGPEVVERSAQAYVGILQRATMREIAKVAGRIPEVVEWLAARGVEPAGAPFLAYRVIDMDRELELEVGVPVASGPVASGPVASGPAGSGSGSGGDVRAGVLPAGRYARLVHLGSPATRVEVTAGLLAWVEAEGLAFDVEDSADGERWGCRLEVLLVGPPEQPDPDQWETELAFKLADG